MCNKCKENLFSLNNYIHRIFCLLYIFLLIIFDFGYQANGKNIDKKTKNSFFQNYSKIMQRDIIWHFDKEYPCGQFANGDWWVIGPVMIIAISPESVISDGRTINGSMINPVSNGNNGFDSLLGSYKSELNISYGISSKNPFVVQVGSSLISTISLKKPTRFTVLKSAEILTVLSEKPTEGCFRPPYVGNNKTVRFNKDMLNYSLLKSLEPNSNTAPLSAVERYFERPWIDFYSRSFSGQYMHPSDNMPAYGRDISRRISEGALMLHLNFPNPEKEKLLISYVQLGIDLFEITKNGNGYRAGWPADGGHASGRKWPVLFAGLMLDDKDMKSIGKKSGDYGYSAGYGPGNPPLDYIHFGEDDQTFYVTADDITRTNSEKWKPDKRKKKEPYNPKNIGMPEWGIRHITHPYMDNQNWEAIYRQCCTAIAWQGYILSALIMDAKSLWNHNSLFDYMDRYMDITNGKPDPFGYKVSGEVSGWRTESKFTTQMWDKYRK